MNFRPCFAKNGTVFNWFFQSKKTCFKDTLFFCCLLLVEGSHLVVLLHKKRKALLFYLLYLNHCGVVTFLLTSRHYLEESEDDQF